VRNPICILVPAILLVVDCIGQGNSAVGLQRNNTIRVTLTCALWMFPSKRVYYLDPKLSSQGSRESSFRTFYFEPKVATNKVRDDAVHFIAGFEHEPREKSGAWKFTRWDVVDLSTFKVKLKAEFQGSNRDMYRPEAIVASSAK
jgi:hypothetical protein